MGKWFLTLFILLMSLNIFDVMATKHILQNQRGSHDLVWIEGNPIGNFMIEHWGYNGIATYKIILAMILGTLLLIYEKRKRIIPLMLVATVPYMAVVSWEIYIIFFLL